MADLSARNTEAVMWGLTLLEGNFYCFVSFCISAIHLHANCALLFFRFHFHWFRCVELFFIFPSHRCFLSAGSPALSPSRSRVVEAICLHLIQKHPQPLREVLASGKKHTTNRWRLILASYKDITARLFNSQALLSDTGLALYSLNETQISLWFKNKTRREEVVTLLQGRSLPGKRETAAEPLPKPRKRQRIVSLAPPIQITEPEDRSGQAKIRRRFVPIAIRPAVSLPSTSAATALNVLVPAVSSSASRESTVEEVPVPPMSRTTAWRHRKKVGDVKLRKVYCCQVCHAPASQSDHGHYYGKKYCYKRPGAPSKEDWYKQVRLERALKKQNL